MAGKKTRLALGGLKLADPLPPATENKAAQKMPNPARPAPAHGQEATKENKKKTLENPFSSPNQSTRNPCPSTPVPCPIPSWCWGPDQNPHKHTPGPLEGGQAWGGAEIAGRAWSGVAEPITRGIKPGRRDHEALPRPPHNFYGRSLSQTHPCGTNWAPPTPKGLQLPCRPHCTYWLGQAESVGGL